MESFILILETLQSEVKAMQKTGTNKELLTKNILHFLEANIKKLKKRSKNAKLD